MSELPKGWITAKISDVTYKCTQSKPEDEVAIKYIDIGSINRQTKKIEKPQSLLGKNAPSRARKIVNTNDVLVSLTRPNLNAVTLVDEIFDKQFASTGFEVLKSLGIESRYLFALVRTNHFVNKISGTVQGALYPAAKSSDVQGYQFPLAPLNEQVRIADKLDSILAKVNKAQSRLDKIPVVLKRFRQSVLAAATSGELTKEWREDNQVNVNWREIKVSDIVSKIEAGKSIKCDERPPNVDEFGIIKISAVTWGVYDEEESKTLKDKSVFLESRRVNVGDFLISRANTLELLGMPVIVHKTTKNLMLSDKVLRLAMDDLNKKWLNYYFRSPAGRLKIENGSSGNQESMRNIGQKSLMAITLNDPDLREKREIVRRVESLFSLAELVEKQFQDARKRTGRLTQSILNKAFRGELVAQNPNDEPASVLLEKIRSNRIKNSTKKISKNVNSKSKSAVTPSKPTATKKVVINQFSNRSKIENKEIASLSKEDAAYVKKAIQNLKDATFTAEQFQSVIGFNKTYEELKTLILTLVKGVSGISEPLIEVVDWNEKDGEYNFRLKDM